MEFRLVGVFWAVPVTEKDGSGQRKAGVTCRSCRTRQLLVLGEDCTQDAWLTILPYGCTVRKSHTPNTSHD
jgi:hypothetical protein